MKKITLITILSLLGIVALSGSALAATFSFSPTSIETTEGQSFNLTATINPQSIKNYTTKLELNYPADLLEVKSFSFGNSWMPLSQTGYDLLDNTNGVLIKTAGYPGGLSSPATFGTISFSAKKTGSGIIKIGSDSLALNAENQNLLSGTPEVSINIKTVVVPTPKTISVPSTVSEQEEPAEEEPIEETPEDETTIGLEEPSQDISQEQPQPPMFAGIFSIITLGTDSKFVGVIVLLVLLVLVYFVVQKIRCRKQE